MVFRKNTQLFILLVPLLLVVQVLGKCSDGLVEHKSPDGNRICCVPVLCSKDHEVVICTANGGRDQCVPCGDGRINPKASSSISSETHRCFNESKGHKTCQGKDTVPIRSANSRFSEKCPIPCECDTSKCFYGDPCACEKSKNLCPADHELNGETGECVKCPADMYRIGDGCGRCQLNTTGWSGPPVADAPLLADLGGTDEDYQALQHTTTGNLPTGVHNGHKRERVPRRSTADNLPTGISARYASELAHQQTSSTTDTLPTRVSAGYASELARQQTTSTTDNIPTRVSAGYASELARQQTTSTTDTLSTRVSAGYASKLVRQQTTSTTDTLPTGVSAGYASELARQQTSLTTDTLPTRVRAGYASELARQQTTSTTDTLPTGISGGYASKLARQQTTSRADTLPTGRSEREVAYNISSPVFEEMTSGGEGSKSNASQTGSSGNNTSKAGDVADSKDNLVAIVVPVMLILLVLGLGVALELLCVCCSVPVMLILLVLGLGLAMFLCIKRKHESGRTGRLVSCYQRIIFKKGNQTPHQVPVEDPEQPAPAETSLVQENGGSKPSQVVKPIVKQSEDSLGQQSEGSEMQQSEGSEVQQSEESESYESQQYTDMSLNADSSCSPLIGSGASTVVETEETDKKAP